MAETLPEVAEDVAWARDTVKAELTKTATDVKIIRYGETLGELSVKIYRNSGLKLAAHRIFE